MKLSKVIIDGETYYRREDTEKEEREEALAARKAEYRVKEVLAVAERLGHTAATALQTAVGAAGGKLASLRQNGSRKSDGAEEMIKLLPYLPPEKMHEAFLLLEAEEDLWKKADIASVLPYLTPDDCDRLFVSFLNGGNRDFRAQAVLPYVSERCLSEVLGGILSGKYDGLSAETLYPYLSKKDLCRLLSVYRRDGVKK